MGETLYIIDGHSQIFRAYYAPFRDLTSPTGEPTRATYVFCSMLLKFLADKQPTYLAMAVDGPAEKLHRRAEFPDYKVTRKPIPEDFFPQEERILQIVRQLDIPVLAAEGYEADDILATLAERFAGDDLDVVLISRDKDLDQLVGPHCVLYDPMADETFDADAIAAKRGYRPDQAVEVQTLMGDSIDNIPGVPGVGPKTAVKLISQYGSADEVLAHADEQTPKLKENLQAAGETVAMSRRLVTLDRNVPLDVSLGDMRFQPTQVASVRQTFAELGFNRLFDQLDKAGLGDAGDGNGDPPGPDASPAGETGQTTSADFDYELIDTPEQLARLVERLRGVQRLAVDTETTSVRPMRAELVGVCLAWKPCHGVYLPVKGPLGARTLELDALRDALGPVLADPAVEKVAHNLKYDLLVLRRAGFQLAGPMIDTMLAAYCLDSQRMTYKLDALAAEFLSHRCIPIEEIIGRGRHQVTMDTVPTDVVAPYAAEDADVTLRLAEPLLEQLSHQGLAELLNELEMPLMPVLADMEQRGIRVDPELLKRMEVDLANQADGLRDRLIALAGRPFNPDSPKQLGEVLFSELQLPVIKKTKTGPSTDSSVLEELAAQHEMPAVVLDYRKLTKLISTYLKALAECIHPATGRVHTSFHQHGTATGRLSSSDPNLQNIPIRTEQGRLIRSAFVAEAGCRLLSADYSQVELRMLAHLCEDPTLRQAFADGLDIHRAVASEVFHVPLDEVTPDQRARAKTVNFGIVYGQTAFGLARTLRISRTEAGEFIFAYKQRFPQIDQFLQACVAHAREHGYVETLFGRRRTIREIDARNPQRRALAERLAINSVVQGSAADLIKQAMVNIDRRIRRENRPSRMLLQIHDELVFEIPDDAVDTEREMIVNEMSDAIQLSVPVQVDVGVGDSWLNAK